jgi:nuclear pore complex protein Nup160
MLLIIREGLSSALGHEDANALAAVLPDRSEAGISTLSQFEFYVHASSLFRSAGHTEQDVHFARLAISVATADSETSGLWYDVIKGYTELSYWDDAYAALMTTPHDRVSVDFSLRERTMESLTHI